LKQLGLDQEVLRHAVPMRGRMMHAVDGTLTFQRYGKDDSECIHSVSRGFLNKQLMTAAESKDGVEILFGHRAERADLDAGWVEFAHGDRVERVQAPCLIGTDGSASFLRDEIVRRTGAECRSEELDYGYKELVIPAGPGGAFKLEKNALHIWPRGTYMLIALPNEDGSFTCTLFLPHEGPLSFEELGQPEQVRQLFSEQFSDVMPLIQDLEKSFFENPTGRMVTVKSAAWHYKDRALLLGDAAHAIVPFFGQGMNCGFEDCTILDELLSRGDLSESVFGAFSASRRPNSDAIADLAVRNFVEMRDKVADPRFLMKKAVEGILQQKFPGQYVSCYSLVTFSRTPYREAYDLGDVQAGILDELCQNLSSPEQVDLVRAGELIRSELLPLQQKGKSHGS
jgi:kynurenine 3-monooxygenase